MTSDEDQRPPSRRSREPRENDPPAAPSQAGPADQGDLWANDSKAEPVEPNLDETFDDFIADLPPAADEPPFRGGPSVYAPGEREAERGSERDYDGDEYSMLRNPYVLAALAVAAAIVLAVGFVVVFSEGGDAPRSSGVISRTPTPLPGQLPGVQAKVIAKAAIREGPGLDFFELGLLNNGQEVSVVGRSDDSSWYQILFAGTELRGWVPDSALRLPNDADGSIEVVLFSPIPKPSVEQPTPMPTPPPAATEGPEEPPDISVEVPGNVCPTSGPINLALRNVGDVDLESRRIVVTVSTPQGVISEQTLAVSLGTGQLVPINTGVEVRPPRTIVAVVFESEPQDSDPSNNVVTCVVEGGGQSGTAVPPPIATP